MNADQKSAPRISSRNRRIPFGTVGVAGLRGDDAAELVEKCKGIIPKVSLQIAKNLIKEEKYEEAAAQIEATSKLAAEFENDEIVAEAKELVPQMWLMKGKKAVELKDYAAAADAFTKSYDADTTNASTALTLAQVLALAARVHSLSHTGEAGFDESYGSRWYDVYYRYCIDNGLIAVRTFRNLNASATRAQTALVLAHALEETDLPVIRRQERIPDVAAGDYAADEIYLLYRAGVLNGMNEAGEFYPQNHLRRSEAAAILLRLADADMRIR